MTFLLDKYTCFAVKLNRFSLFILNVIKNLVQYIFFLSILLLIVLILHYKWLGFKLINAFTVFFNATLPQNSFPRINLN